MDLFQLVAKLSLDSSEYEKGIDNAKGRMSGLSKSVKSGAKILGAATVAAIGAASAAVGALIKKSIDGYAEQQQMVGGVQKLYGNMGKSLEEYAKSVGLSTEQAKSKWSALEKAQNLVLKNSQKAYKTTGMSANEYMSLATSFSASLINSLGGDTVKAAKQTDVAMRAISDNFNTFGGDIGMIQGAFQGFAKQNYTMLDNLKLGYGGTKTEMQRLIKDANTWAKENGKAADLSIDSFSDVVTAIDYIQQKQNIAGTTARESSTTIEGSLLSLKAAWDNLVTGFASPDADISSLMENLVESAATAGSNLIPAVMQALEGIGTAIDELLPVVIDKIPAIFDNVAVPLIETGAKFVTSLVLGFTEAFPSIAQAATNLITNLTTSISGDGGSKMIESGLRLVTSLAKSIGSNVGPLIAAAVLLVGTLATQIIKNLPRILTAGADIVRYLLIGIGTAIDILAVVGNNILNKISESISNFAQDVLKPAGEQIIKAISEAVGDKFSEIAKAVSEKMKEVKDAVIKAWNGIKSSFTSQINSIKSSVSSGFNAIKSRITSTMSSVKGKVTSVVNGIKSGMINGFNTAKSKVISIFESIKSGISKKIEAAKDKVKEVIDKIKGFFPFNVGKIFSGWIPKISLKTSKSGDSAKTNSSVSKQNFAKAMSQPYMFRRPTEFYAGEAGDEMLYGKHALMNDIASVVEGQQESTYGRSVQITNYITVEGAEDPEDFTERFIRKLKLDMRTA